MNMKELTDGELIDLAYRQIKIGDKHLISQAVITILIIIQATFFIFEMISVYFYFPLWLVCMVLVLFHRKQIKNSETKVQEILDELTSRNK